LKVFVLGLGSVGRRHVQNLLTLNNEVVIYTKRKDIKDLKKKCEIYDSLEKCLKSNPDFAIISNVTSLHVKTAIKLAKHRLDLFIEKPLSDSMKNVHVLQKLIKKNKLTTLMGCNLRFHECVLKVKEIIDSGKIGRIISVQADSGSYLPYWHPYEDYRKSYASRKNLGGGVVLTCIHEIDYLYWFFGDVKEVISFTGNFSDLGISSEDLSSILLKFKNGVIGEVHLDYFQRPSSQGCKVIGTKGTIVWDSNENIVKVYDTKRKRWVKKMKIKKYDRNAMYLSELIHFIRCLKRRKKTVNPLEEGIKTLEIALAIKKSSKQKKVVTL